MLNYGSSTQAVQELLNKRNPFRPAIDSNYESLPLAKTRPFIFNQEAISNLSLIDQVLFEKFGQGAIASVPYGTMHKAFEAYVMVQPEETAVIHQNNTLSYGQLDRHANRLAAILAQHGVTTGDNVALFLQRSVPMIVGIMATLKAGAAYVPQHVGVAPEAHLQYVIATAKTKVILTLSHLRHLIPVPEGHICLAIDELMQEPFANDEEYTTPFAPATPPSRNHTCFIIFTSGTTGNPNGVQVTHGNVANILLTEPGNLGMRPGMKVGQILNIAFDMAAWEILGSLSNGATLAIRGKDFMETVRQVDVVISTPSILSTFDAGQCQNVKVVAVAGEPCPRPLADKWAQFCTFYNSCGPTETTIVNTAQHYLPWNERLTIGKPTPNNTVYVLDENLRPLPMGEVGEMWAGGDCVSAGYIGNAELTNERYRPDPFLGNGRFMFRTRDLGRWTTNGELEHLGRTDDQVKIRGFRVELDSVSAALESTPGCIRAVALKLDSRHLVAFVSPATVDPEEAKTAVSTALPYYCTPKFVIAMDELIMTSRGKIDKRALLKLAQSHQA
jgi:amino acid adenylation domain-containing protein